MFSALRTRFSPHSLNTFKRTYAGFSRFPERNVGSSRNRGQRPRPGNGFEYDAEPTPSEDESQAWHTSQRPPTSDPEEGLRNLLMNNEVLVVERQLEMLNVFLGFEQSNRYSISNEGGETLGYIAEEPRGFLSMFSRQVFRTHRPFRAIVMDASGSPILWLRRPFAWINSRMYVQRLKDWKDYTPEGEPILDTFAEVQQRWHPIRRKYDLFLRDSPRRILSLASDPQPEPAAPVDDMFNQFARVDSGFLAWNFSLQNQDTQSIAHIGRAFRGLGREIFTDTGRYFVRFGPDPTPQVVFNPITGQVTVKSQEKHRDLTLEERALTLSLAVNIDFDYFSRHSHGGMGMGGVWMSTGE